MRKFVAVVKREYVQRVRSRMFTLVTLLAPVIMACFAIAPVVIFSIKAGGPLKIAVVDQTGKLYQRVYDSVQESAGSPRSGRVEMNANALGKDPSRRFEEMGEQRESSFQLEEVPPGGRPI